MYVERTPGLEESRFQQDLQSSADLPDVKLVPTDCPPISTAVYSSRLQVFMPAFERQTAAAASKREIFSYAEREKASAPNIKIDPR